jgi:chorismate lyase/3-hydroxybenzoate synthase
MNSERQSIMDSFERPVEAWAPGSDEHASFVALPRLAESAIDENDKNANPVEFIFGAQQESQSTGNVIPIWLDAVEPDSYSEFWQMPGNVDCGRDGDIKYVASDNYLLANLNVALPDYDQIENIVESAYMLLLDFGQTRGFAHLARIWNYMPDINKGDGDDEFYRRFIVGRAHAFDIVGYSDSQLPAATAIGSAVGTPLSITILSASTAVPMIGNSRQVDPFLYPSEHGSRSPSFSRAAIVTGKDANCLLVSGTASVVGHESRHQDDAAEQAQETCENILQIVRDAKKNSCRIGDGQLSANFRVYLRRAEDLATVQEIHRRYFGASPTVFLLGNICRRELLLESEAVFCF